MKTFKLTRKVQIILATIFVMTAGIIIVSLLTNNKASAATKPCLDSNCSGTMYCHNTGTGMHRWDCNVCSVIRDEACSGGSWIHKSGTSVHQKFCWACGYFYTQESCYDNNNDGNCDAGCGNTGMHTHSYSSTSYSQNNSSVHNVTKSCSCGATQSAGTEAHTFGSYTNNGNGQHSRTCSKCGYTQTEAHAEVVDAAVAATCTQAGITEGRHCSVCNTVITAQQTIPVKGHTEVVDAAIEPTCTQAGKTEGKHCSVCNEVLVAQQEILAKGHAEVIDAAIEPTCTETGITQGKHCSVCNEVLVAQEEIPAKGHTEVIDAAIEPTCTETGITQGKHCSVCNEVLVAQEEVPAKGHNYVDGECTECGKQQYDDIETKSEKYEIDDIYISKIQPKTTVKELKEGIQTNAIEMKIYDSKDNLLTDTDIIGTKAKIELKIGNKTKTYTAIVKGDVDGDGIAGILDMAIINKYRLNKKTLEEVYLKAADVTEDNKINLTDIIKINKYRLNKITEL